MKFAAVPVLVLLTAIASHAQPAPQEDDSMRAAALIPLFVACDFTEELLTPGLDERELRWLETPVSREGARLHLQERGRVDVSSALLVLEAHSVQVQHSPAAPFDAQARQGKGHIRLLASEAHGTYEPASGLVPERTGSSTWVRIRALYVH